MGPENHQKDQTIVIKANILGETGLAELKSDQKVNQTLESFISMESALFYN